MRTAVCLKISAHPLLLRPNEAVQFRGKGSNGRQKSETAANTKLHIGYQCVVGLGPALILWLVVLSLSSHGRRLVDPSGSPKETG